MNSENLDTLLEKILDFENNLDKEFSDDALSFGSLQDDGKKAFDKFMNYLCSTEWKSSDIKK